MSAVATGVLVLACASAGVCGWCAVLVGFERRRRKERRARMLSGIAALRRKGSAPRGFGLAYAAELNRRLFAGSTTAISPAVRSRRAAETRAGRAFLEQARLAGVEHQVGVSAYCEAGLRLALAGGLAGALLGAPFSNQLAFVLGAAGAVLGRTLPARALRQEADRRAADAERHLSEMLEVVALGLRSGLTFDRSFALYGTYFGSDFAKSCTKAYRKWALGLASREDALRELAASYRCDGLARVVDTVVRGLRFGTSLADGLEEAAAESRAAYRTALAEKVAKAPVKMMLPTGTLILPAMLLLVMGPILLELASGF